MKRLSRSWRRLRGKHNSMGNCISTAQWHSIASGKSALPQQPCGRPPRWGLPERLSTPANWRVGGGGVAGAAERAGDGGGGGRGGHSWLDFWFGGAAWVRKVFGSALLLVLTVALLPSLVKPNVLTFLP